MFNAAVEDRLISLSPVRKISRQPVSRARVVPPSVAQVDALVAATPDRYRAMIITAVGSGLRQGELLGLRAAEQARLIFDEVRRVERQHRRRRGGDAKHG